MSLKYGERNITDIFVGDQRIIKRIQDGNVLYEKSSKPVFDDRFCFYNPNNTPAVVSYKGGWNSSWGYGYENFSLQKSADGVNFEAWGNSNKGSTVSYTLKPHEILYVRGSQKFTWSGREGAEFSKFIITDPVECHGNLACLMGDAKNMYGDSMRSVFYNCTGLLTAPDIIFDSIQITMNHQQIKHPMDGIFSGCTNLVSVGKIKANRIDSLYGMFERCTNLKQVPKDFLSCCKDTNLGYMFWECTSLEHAPDIKIETYEYTDLRYMFQGCKVLKDANIDADVKSIQSNSSTSHRTNIDSMFKRCTNISEIRISSKVWDIPRNQNITTGVWTDALSDGWLADASSSGTIYKQPSINPPNNVCGIPAGWTVQDI